MTLKNILALVTQELRQNSQIKATILYGSLARGTARPQSDVDLALWTTDSFEPEALSFSFQNHLKRVQYVYLRNKIVLYFNNGLRAELAFSPDLGDFSKNYLGSEIQDIESSILFDHTGKVLPFLQNLQSKANAYRLNGKPSDIQNAISKFIYEFENASASHRRSDAYKFYYFYNIALHEALKLFYWSKGETQFSFLPKNITNSNLLSETELSSFYSLNGTLFLRSANDKKRSLLDFFYSSISNLPNVSEAMRSEITDFCEWVFNRDALWNFRDIATHNALLKPGVIFRSAQASIYLSVTLQKILDQHSILHICDLRDDDEVAKQPYDTEMIKQLNYFRAPIDPRIQDDEFIEMQKGKGYSDHEIAYRYFAYRSYEAIGLFFKNIVNQTSGSFLLHCVAGRDRTGCVISLIHLLANAPIEIIEEDYLASEMGTTVHLLHVFLDAVREQGGIQSFLNRCGLNDEEINVLRNKLLIES
jgi:protein tyrosine/serine phosphatase/predicted nucleotidyltransferase